MEHLQSSGTKIMMREPFVWQLCVGRSKLTRDDVMEGAN